MISIQNVNEENDRSNRFLYVSRVFWYLKIGHSCPIYALLTYYAKVDLATPLAKVLLYWTYPGSKWSMNEFLASASFIFTLSLILLSLSKLKSEKLYISANWQPALRPITIMVIQREKVDTRAPWNSSFNDPFIYSLMVAKEWPDKLVFSQGYRYQPSLEFFSTRFLVNK